MSSHGTFQGPTERDAVRAACQTLLAEPKMLEYTVLELKEPTKTRFRTTQGHCSIEVTGINRNPAPSRPKREASSESSSDERALVPDHGTIAESGIQGEVGTIAESEKAPDGRKLPWTRK